VLLYFQIKILPYSAFPLRRVILFSSNITTLPIIKIKEESVQLNIDKKRTATYHGYDNEFF